MKRLLNIGLVDLVVVACLPVLMFAALAIALLCAGSLMVFGHTLEPDESYELFVGHPPSSDVTRIEGIGGGWQGHDFWLRF